jgi:glycosyltransferase involved in cell wall biosynthesis
MVYGKKVVVVLPAYNAEKTLAQTVSEIPEGIVDEIVLTDDGSSDQTVEVAQQLGIHHVIRHDLNRGYGANQKTCYQRALQIGADIVIMLHPDYQYTPRLIPYMAYLIAGEVYSVVLGSRILGGAALRGGMPAYKYVANRVLTFVQNLITGAKLSEYHTGYRAFSSQVLRTIDFSANSDGYIFDNEMLSQIILADYEIAEVTCPARYFPEASSISFVNSLDYGFGVLRVSLQHGLCRVGALRLKRYQLLASLKSSKSDSPRYAPALPRRI